MAYESSYDNIYFKIKKYTLFADCHFFGTTYFLCWYHIFFISTGFGLGAAQGCFLFPKSTLYISIGTRLLHWHTVIALTHGYCIHGYCIDTRLLHWHTVIAFTVIDINHCRVAIGPYGPILYMTQARDPKQLLRAARMEHLGEQVGRATCRATWAEIGSKW